jgi:BASS family bile acid:Na+ symporter
MPILAIVLAQLFDIRRVAEIALVALAISPVPPLLPRKEAKAGGDSSYGLALMAMLAIAAIVAVPLWAEILERVIGRPLGASPLAIARAVGITAVAPLVAGMAVRAMFPSIAGRLERLVRLVVKVLLPLAILVLLAGSWRPMWNALGEGAMVAMVIFVVAGLLVGHVLGGPDRHRSVVLALSTASRHPAIALSIASANFPDEHFGGTILLYLILNALIVVAYLSWRRNRLPAVPAESP